MLYSTLSVSLLLAGLAAAGPAETVHGAVIFSRHGDRTWKGAPPTRLTTLGQNQLYSSGQFWRSRYVSSSSPKHIAGVNSDTFNPAQISASAPDQTLLVNSAQSFLQGLYPPLEEVGAETLANGTKLEGPLDGYQYIPLHTIPTDSAQTLWLKGDDACPAQAAASGKWNTTAEHDSIKAASADFYASLYDSIFAGVLAKSKLTYDNAYSIFDYVNVGMNHNASIYESVSADDLAQLRFLADKAEFAQVASTMGDTADAVSIGGRTLVGKFLTDITATVASPSVKQKLSVLVGSYDSFLSFFAVTGLAATSDDFQGLPDYASTLAFEVFSTNNATETKDMSVRFLFRNGTDDNAPAREFALFGREEAVMSFKEFEEAMGKAAITSTAEWCGLCGNEEDAFCLAEALKAEDGVVAATRATKSSGLTPEIAGVVGAMVTLGVFMLGSLIAIALGVRLHRKSKVTAVGVTMGGKEIAESVSTV